MSLTMSKADGVTVLTLTTDSDSSWPPLCQILKSLCYSPACCSVSQRLRTIQRTSLSVLGTLQIIVGLLNIGLGTIFHLTGTIYLYLIYEIGYPYWLGALFIAFGIMCILSEKYPSQCLIILNMILNLAGVAFAVTAIVFHSISIAMLPYRVWWYNCGRRDYPSLEDRYFRENCFGENLSVMLLSGICGVLVVLSVLELCVVISAIVLGIKALKSFGEEQNKSSCDPKLFKPLLEEVTTTNSGN